MADQMPRDIRKIAKLRLLGFELLHAIFAESSQARIVRGSYRIRRKCFRYRYKPDFLGAAPRTLRRTRDPLVHFREIVGEGNVLRGHGRILTRAALRLLPEESSLSPTGPG